MSEGEGKKSSQLTNQGKEGMCGDLPGTGEKEVY